MICTVSVLVALSACGGAPDGPALGPQPPPEIETRTADLAAYVDGSLAYVQAFSEGYVVPSPVELNRFDALLTSFLDQDLDTANTIAGDAGYRVIRLIDSGAADNELYCLEEVMLQGRGFYCVDHDAANTHHVSAPHPLYDSDTNTASVTVMRGTGAKYFSLSSTHRCSNAATSSCSGTTAACGAPGPYKVSDVAHNVDSYFQHFGEKVHDAGAFSYTIQLHGCGGLACPSNSNNSDIVARVSAGTVVDLAAFEPVNDLNARLNGELLPYRMGVSLSCSDGSADKQLCATDNTLGRYVNGQPKPCGNAATSFSGSRFLHIEQNANLRRDDGAGDDITPDTLVNAINASLGAP